MSKTTTDLTTLKINYLSQEAYDAEISGGTIEEDEIYLTPSTPHIIGQIIAYAGANEPIGWLKCDGRAVSRTIYSALYSVVGTTYGSGDGSTTFNLPNFKGRFPIGVGSIDAGDSTAEAYWGGTAAGSVNCSLGEKAGEAWHTLNISQMPSHHHLLSSGWQSASGQPDRVTYGAVNGGYYISGAGAIQFIQDTGGGGAHNNMPPYIAVNYLIYVGVSVII